MILIAWLVAYLAAAAATFHRDERGQLGFFKDLISKLTGGVEGIRDWIVDLGNKLWQVIANGAAALGGRLREVQDALWERLGHLGQTLWDVAVDGTNKLFAAIANAAVAVIGRLREVQDALWERLGHLGQTLWDVAVDGSNKLFSAIAHGATAILGGLGDLGNKLFAIIAHGATALYDGIIFGAKMIFDRLGELGTIIAGSAERVAKSADDVGEAIKDAPGQTADAAGSVIERLMGFGPELFGDMAALGERALTDGFDSTDELIAAMRGVAPESTITERVLFIPINIASVLAWVTAGASARAEVFVQDVRKEFPATLLNLEDLREASLRGLIDGADVRDQLARAGFSPANIDSIVALWQLIPSPSDLVRMAVREAFSPEVVARFGQDQDFPPDFARFMEQQGFTEEWARRFWSAHWGLPSANQGFEMFHRGVIDRDTLNLLLRALDVMPFWRERLTEIAFNPVTRVDTRRLFGAGVWARDQVLRSYLDQGYRPDNAEALTAWTAASFSEDGPAARDLTRTAIEKAYRQGRLTDVEAVARLVDLGYDEDEADFFISNVRLDLELSASADAERSVRDLTQTVILRAYRDKLLPRGDVEALLADLGYTPDGIELILAVQDFDAANELTTLAARVTEQRFRRGLIDDAAALGELVTAGLQRERAELMVQRWVIQFSERTRELTEAQLNTAMQAGTIDEATYVLRLTALGYAEEDALILLANRGRATTEQVRQLSRTTITGLYKRGIISRDDAFLRLVAAGFIEGDAELLLVAADQDREKAAAAAGS